MRLHRKKKVEIVTDTSMRDEVARLLMDHGATGYTLLPEVSGQGSRGVRDSDDIFDVFSNVQFTVVCAQATADKIVQEVMRLLEEHPRMVLVSDVDVVRDDHF